MTELLKFLVYTQNVVCFGLAGARPGDHWNSAGLQQDKDRTRGRQKTIFGLI